MAEGESVVVGLTAVPDFIRNNSSGSVVIHDLKLHHSEPSGYHVPPGKEKIHPIMELFGADVCKRSQGLRHALEKGLVVAATPGEKAPAEKQTLGQEMEEKVGKVPSRRRTPVKPGQTAAPVDEAFKSRVSKHVKKPNKFDKELSKVKVEVKEEVVT